MAEDTTTAITDGINCITASVSDTAQSLLDFGFSQAEIDRCKRAFITSHTGLFTYKACFEPGTDVPLEPALQDGHVMLPATSGGFAVIASRNALQAFRFGCFSGASNVTITLEA